jgi:hypothetical protein
MLDYTRRTRMRERPESASMMSRPNGSRVLCVAAEFRLQYCP